MNSSRLPKQSEDRISNLHSSLQTKILSCLPTKDAVKTSILSRKWEKSWTFVTNLDFDDKLVRCCRDGDDKYIISDEDFAESDFAIFVDRVLSLRETSPLQRFRMRCSGRDIGPLVDTWIAAILPYAQEIDLSFPLKHPSLLTPDVFTCKTLTVLKLDANGRVYMPTPVCLPLLKTLHLAHMELLDDVSIRNLLSGCPVIEELNLRRCLGNDVCVVNITAPTLTNLTLEELPYDTERYDSDYWYEIVLDAPALKLLNLNDYEAEGYVIKNSNHLLKAVITVGVTDDEMYGNYEATEIRSKAMLDLLNGVSQVQSLVLSHESMWAIHFYGPALPIFSNLTSLELSTTRYAGWLYLLKFLKNSPCLESFYLHKKETKYDAGDYLTDEEVPSCLVSHLKVIKIETFEGLADDMEMIEYILENAKVLEKLTIDYQPPISFYTDENTWEIDDFYKKLSKLKRVSNVCKVEVL